jgi:hypothetical protein
MTLVTINSQAERNLRKIGMRHSWFSHRPKEISKNYNKRGIVMHVAKFALVEVMGLVCILLSWVQVAFFIGTIFYSLAKDSGAPTDVKEFRWKMRNRELSFDEIVAGLALTSGQNTSPQWLGDQIREEMRDRGLA